jgi:penicillin amidase
VKGEKPHSFIRYSTHHGPLVSQLFGFEDTIALASSTLRETISFEGYSLLNSAHNWNQFSHAISRIDSHLNFVYADVHDNIGYYLSGKIPIRGAGGAVGSVPSAGWTGNSEWNRFIPHNEMPHCLNPPNGFIVTANSYIADPTYAHWLGDDYAPNSRSIRLRELIESSIARGPVTLQDSVTWQMDTLDIYARETVPRLVDALEKIRSEESALMLRWLEKWDFEMRTDSIAATLWMVWKSRFARCLIESKTDNSELVEIFLGKGFHPLAKTNYLGNHVARNIAFLMRSNEKLQHWFGSEGKLNEAFERSARETVSECRKLLGDAGEWQWGKLHTFKWTHSMNSIAALDRLFSLGPFPAAGNADTPYQTSSEYGSWTTSMSMPSYRQVVDLANVSRSLFDNAPGQSGHLSDVHYDDMMDTFLQGKLLQVNF